MPDTDEALRRQNAALTRQLLEWVAAGAHTYDEALDVWRSSCPRHTIWEDALEAGLIDCAGPRGRLELTSAGRALLGAPRERH
jgi:hypothetical protein